MVSPFVKQCFVTAAVGINIIGHGCALGFPAVLLPQLRQPNSRIQLTMEEESWMASVTSLFILAGNFIPIMDKLGRKTAHYALTIPSIAGWFIVVVATNVKVLIVARAILGVACGQLNNIRSVLIGECTSPKYRGAFLTTVSLTQAFGTILVYLLGSFFSWQITALICSFFSFTSLLMIIYTPESPSWLAGRGRYDECRKIFRWLRGDEEEEELTELINARIELDKENCLKSNNFVRTALQTVVKKEFYKPIILVIHANTLMSFSEATTMSNYATVILMLIMGPTANVYLWMPLLDTQRILTNTVAIYIINRVKRRTMLFTFGGIFVLSYLAIAVYVYGKWQGWMPMERVWFPGLLITMQIFTVGMAMVPMPNIIGGEVFPLEYRGIGGTISTALLAVIAFVIVKTFPGLIDAMGLQGTYFLYSIILTYCLLVIWVLLPETNGRTLQQIEDEWRERSLKNYETEVRKPLRSSHETFDVKRKIDKDGSM